jgi:hypothetical protein
MSFKNKAARPKQKKDIVLFIVIVAITIFVIFMISFIVRFVRVFPRQKEFISHLSTSTVYAYENDGVDAVANGEEIHASGDSLYDLYAYLSYSTTFIEQKKNPETDYDLYLDYGEGSLTVWQLDTTNDNGMHDLFLYYEDDDYHYAYVTDDRELSVIIRYLEHGEDND